MTQAQALEFLAHTLHGWAEEAELWTTLGINCAIILGFLAWAFDPDAKLADGRRRMAFVLGTFFRLVGVAAMTLFNVIFGLAMIETPGLVGGIGWVLFPIFLLTGIGLAANLFWRFSKKTA